MNKTDLVKKMSTKSALNQKQSLAALNAFCELVTETLKSGDNVTLTGFGKFEVKNRKARSAFNPKSREMLTIPATRVPAFKVGKSLKSKILA